MGKIKTIAVWVLSVLCALMFLAIGGMSLVNYNGQATEGFAHFGYPDWFRVLIAVLYLAGGLLLLLPRFAWMGSATLAVIMIGAVVSHLKEKEYFPEPLPGAVLFVILALITYVRWPRSASKTM
jgi:putative oxidoreductase